MHRHLLRLLLTISVASAAKAQQPAGCTGPNGVPVDSLYAHARRLHPDVAKPENQSSFVIVALVYDNKCEIVRHAMKRVARPGDIETILSSVFPDSSRLTMRSFEISGFAALRSGTKSELDQMPVIAWGLLTPRGIPR